MHTQTKQINSWNRQTKKWKV